MTIIVFMKRIPLLILTALVLLGCRQAPGTLTLLIGTYTDTDSKGIYTYRFNLADGTATPLSVTEIANPSFLAVTPDLQTVYAVTEQSSGAGVSSFAFDAAEGTLALKNRQAIEVRNPCHICFLGKSVTVANYSSGSLSYFPLAEDGSLEPGRTDAFSGSGPDSLRQEHPHIHSSIVSPDGRYVFVIDLGSDAIYRYPLADGRITDFEPVRFSTPAGQGPRHSVFSKDGRFFYVITELGGDVLAYEYSSGDLRLIQEIEADPLHARGSADIHFSPDGKFLYASNRLQGDGIAIFRQDPATGLLEYVGYQYTGIHPRNFAITPDGRFVLVACRDSDGVQVFRRDSATGLLKDSGKDIKVPRPVCIIPCRTEE